MTRFRTICFMAVGLGAMVGFLSASQARADFIITLTDVGTGTTITIDATTATVIGGPAGGTVGITNTPTNQQITYTNNTFGNFKNLNIQVTSNSPGLFIPPNQGLAQATDSEVTVKNATHTADTLTLSVTSSAPNDFTVPNGSPLTLTSSLSAPTLSNGGSASLTSTMDSPPNTYTTGTATITGTPSGFGVVPASSTVPVTYTSPFSVTNTMTLSLGANGIGNVQGQSSVFGNSTNVVVPEPGTWALALAGFSGLGGLGFLRRRSKSA